MAHRRTGGGKRGELSEVTDNFASLVFGGFRKPPEYGRVFSRTASNNFLRFIHRLRVGSQTEQQGRDGKTAYSLYVGVVLQKHTRECLSSTFFYGSDTEEEKLHEALARHAQCCEEDGVDPPDAAAVVNKALAPRLEVIALDRVGAGWNSLEEYFALNASISACYEIIVAG